MLDRLRALDDRLLSTDVDTQLRFGTVATAAMAVVAMILAVASLHDGQTPQDWRILVPAFAIAAAALRTGRSNDLPGGSIGAKAVTGTAIFLALIVGGVSESLAAALCLVGVGAWTAVTPGRSHDEPS